MKTTPTYLKAKRIASVSPRHRSSRAAYNKEAKRVTLEAKAAGMTCPIAWWAYGKGVTVECVHHLRGKHCEELRHDKRGWMLVSMLGHDWVDQNRAKARVLGFLADLGKWNTKFKPYEPPMTGSVADLVAKGLWTPPKDVDRFQSNR